MTIGCLCDGPGFRKQIMSHIVSAGPGAQQGMHAAIAGANTRAGRCALVEYVRRMVVVGNKPD